MFLLIYCIIVVHKVHSGGIEPPVNACIRWGVDQPRVRYYLIHVLRNDDPLASIAAYIVGPKERKREFEYCRYFLLSTTIAVANIAR